MPGKNSSRPRQRHYLYAAYYFMSMTPLHSQTITDKVIVRLFLTVECARYTEHIVEKITSATYGGGSWLGGTNSKFQIKPKWLFQNQNAKEKVNGTEKQPRCFWDPDKRENPSDRDSV